MHWYSVGFILALLAFGGIAAYLGDILGYRLGKRRLSLLRLRPRTTARLVGILAGILIPAVTVLVGYWQIDYVRIALVELDDLRRELDTLQHERDTMMEQRDLLRTQRNGLRLAARSAQEEARDSKDELDGVRTALEETTGHLDTARSGMDRLRVERGRLRGEKERIQTGLDDAEASLGAAQGALEAATASLDRVEEARDAAEEQRDELSVEVDGLRQRYATLRGRYDTLVDAWEDRHSAFASTSPIFDLGTELVRGVVERPDDLDALKNDIVALLVLADQVAEAGGAGIGDNDRYVRAVGPSPPDALPEEQQWPPESRVLGFVVRQLWDAAGDSHVVQVVVSRRTFLREPAYVVFVARPNRLLFHKGEAIVARQVPPGLDAVEVFEQFWLLIADPSRSEVRKQAKASGMMPDPATGRYGEVHVRQLFQAAKQCEGRAEPTTVRVEAAADAYTSGPLSITIEVESASGGAG